MQKHQKYEDHLMQAIGFDEADLAANQAGVLSARQCKLLLRRAALDGLAVVALTALIWQPSLTSKVVVFVLFGVFWIGGLLELMTYIRDLVFRRAACVEGYVQQDIRYNRVTRHLVVIESRHFEVRKSKFLAFKNGDPYRIYYAPHTKRILSVEWLRDNDDNLLE